MAEYPDAVWAGNGALQDRVHFWDDDKANAMNDEVVAIETELGTNPAGDYDDVAARLDVLEEIFGSISDDFSSALGANWSTILGALEVSGGYLRATDLDPIKAYLWLDEDPTMEGATPQGWWTELDGTKISDTAAAEERTGGSGSQCVEIEVTDGATGSKGVYNYMSTPFGGATWIAQGWLRKVTVDAYDVKFGVGEWGDDDTTNYDTAVSSTEWAQVEAEFVDTADQTPRILVEFDDDDAALGTKARFDDVYLNFGMASVVRDDWHSSDVMIDAELYTPASGYALSGFVLRYEDDDNLIYVIIEHGTNDTIHVAQLLDGTVYTWHNENAGGVGWTAGGNDHVRVRLQGESLHLDHKLSGESSWTEDEFVCNVILTDSTQHGPLLMRTSQNTFSSVIYSDPPDADHWRNTVFQQVIVIPGTMTGPFDYRVMMPVSAQIEQISMVQGNAGDARVKIGITDDNDCFLTYTTLGQSGIPVVIDERTQFRFDGYPVIHAGETFQVYIDHDGIGGTAGQDVVMVFTFREIQ